MNYFADISPVTTALLTLALPFAAFLYQALLGKRAQSGIIPAIAIALSALFGLLTFVEIWNYRTVHIQTDWFTIGNKTFTVGILLNNLTALMLLIVPVIALPVHLYSRSYMHGDKGIHRYWMYLSLFCFAMLGLVMMNNLLLMYIFWELVGFASYLLIGFWFTKESAAQANKKAFIINRIGDLGFLTGIAIVYSQFGTLNLVELFGSDGLAYQAILSDGQWISPMNTMPAGWLTAAGIAFFIGAMAKSAQFPLHVWLPDAMEGPTSVSSLIHAATMVAAGVFLMATLFPLFNETVLLVIAVIGTLTAASAAYFALAQYDIKRILAFSTISQLGYMMVGIGIGAWDAAIFHLATHAFFKCLLFLCAGAVIHEMVHLKEKSQQDFDAQDLRNMGGLRKYMPKTFALMALSSLTLSGFPLTSGYLSKDSIVISAFEWSSTHGAVYHIIPVVLIVVSILTAFYIGRLIFKAFFGQLRVPSSLTAPVHEAPKMMLIPMFFLALWCFFPIFSFNPLSYHHAWIVDGLLDQYPYATNPLAHLVIPVILTLGALGSWWVGYKWYVKNEYPFNPQHRLIQASLKQGYLNELYTFVFVDGTVQLAKICYWIDRNIVDGIVHLISIVILRFSAVITWIDRVLVDGFVNLVAKTAYWLGNVFRHIQNGRLQYYLFSVFFVVLIGLVYLIIK
ncbi:NADH-quinone oxidoreductase subunit L [Sphingobacterium spiritivorum]|uniref:NADH-quinone oxidoreductase subunit L n=1 Tax=Sphingobacterium spiritivorum TaxID=258 RepID=UPI003DA35E7D